MGLGDGLIALVLSNNLALNGCSVTTFHPFLSGLQGWFPHLPIRPFPKELESFDRYFFIFEKSPWMQPLLAECQKHYPEKTMVLNPIATANRDYPYWETGRFDGRRPFAENLYVFCKERLRLQIVTPSNGIVVPDLKRVKNRIVFHPTSSRVGKNWSPEKYTQLAHALNGEGYTSAFILTEEERKGWDLTGIEAPHFNNLSEMATFVGESAMMIGNDSGIGHLASALKIPTITICRSAQASRFWRPAWSQGAVITPSSWIPNIKGLRLRDQHWKKWISVGRVLKEFHQICG